MCAHTHPLGSHRLHTVSGRFLSLSSLRLKHWLRMGFSELHMVCEGRAGITVEAQGQAGQLSGAEIIQSPDPQPSPWRSSSPPSGSGREGRCFYPETLRGESRREGRQSPSPSPPGGTQPQGPHQLRCRSPPRHSAGGGTPRGLEISWSAGQPACAWGDRERKLPLSAQETSREEPGIQ